MKKNLDQSFRLTDLFAGAGGLTAGFALGDSRFHPVQAVEFDIDAAATYSVNYPSADVYFGDIVEWVASRDFRRSDVIVGGPPCQGFSTLGKQKVDDEKNFLWHQYAEVVEAVQPKYFVMENVPQFATSPQRDVLEQELNGGKLADYVARIETVNCKDYGSPQSRKRMLVLGSRKDMPVLRTPAQTHFMLPRTVREAFEGLDPKVDETDLPDRSVVFANKKRPGVFTSQELHLTRNYAPISLERFAHIPEGGNRFNLPDELKAPCWVSHTSGSGDVMGRLHWDRPSVTIRTEFNKPEKGRYLHPDEDRAITHFEAARIMGFPDDYKWVGSKTSIARQIGNAVPIELGAALARRIAELIDSVNS